MTKKSFFAERTAEQIQAIDPTRVWHAHNLTRRILDLAPDQALELRFGLIPGRFYQHSENSAQASRKCYKHGDLVLLSQPRGQEQACRYKDIPLAIRARDFNSLRKMREEEINVVGYAFYPVQGNDRRKRVVPLVWAAEKDRLFGYAKTKADGIKIHPYDDSGRVKYEGADILCTVPSRTIKKPRYKIKLENVPVEGTTERRAIIWGIKSDFEIDPEHSQYNMRKTFAEDREGSDIFTFYPHDMAAYLAVAEKYWKEHNPVPMEMNPFSITSKRTAEHYVKLCNNILIYDPTLSSKSKLRKPHLAEKSILLARLVSVLGHDETLYWDPVRDGRLSEYNWSIPGEK